MINRLAFTLTLTLLITAHASSASSSSSAPGPGDCDVPVWEPCSATSYANLHINTTQGACNIDQDCLPPHVPPKHLSLICEATGQHYACEAWPRGKDAQDFTYDWFATGSLSVSEPGPSTSPLNTVSCPPASQGGFVSVVVTSPFGLSTTHFVELSCPSSD